MTLNMLKQTWLTPELLAYEQVRGIHNFEQTPLAPLVCKVKIYEKSHKRINYSRQSVSRWYIGPSVHHYRCYNCYNIDTGGETTPDIIAFLPEFMKMPNYSLIGMDINTAADLENVLQTPRP